MTATTLYQVDERMHDRRASFAASPEMAVLGDLLAEIVEVVKGSLLPLGSATPELPDALRRDLGLD